MCVNPRFARRYSKNPYSIKNVTTKGTSIGLQPPRAPVPFSAPTPTTVKRISPRPTPLSSSTAPMTTAHTSTAASSIGTQTDLSPPPAASPRASARTSPLPAQPLITFTNAHDVRFDTFGRPMVMNPLTTDHMSLRFSMGFQEIYNDIALTLKDPRPADFSLRYLKQAFRQEVFLASERDRDRDRILGRLQHRVQSEIVDGKRPALRKVVNRDLHPGVGMVLTVLEILSNNSLQLSDGNYFVMAVLDPLLLQELKSRKIVVGSLLFVTNAKLTTPDPAEGVDPLDDNYDSRTRLSLYYNTTRLAKRALRMTDDADIEDDAEFTEPKNWTSADAPEGSDASQQLWRDSWDCGQSNGADQPRLGLAEGYARTNAIVVPLDSLRVNGGNTPLVDVVVERVFRTMVFVCGDWKPEDAGAFPSQPSQMSQPGNEDELLKEIDESAPQVWKSMARATDDGEFYGSLSDREQREVDNWKEERCVKAGAYTV